MLETNQIALKLWISDNRWRLNPQFTLFCGALFNIKILCTFVIFFKFGASDGLIWSEISQEFQKYSNFVYRTKIGGLIDKKTDFIFDSFRLQQFSLKTKQWPRHYGQKFNFLSKNHDSFLPSKSVKFWFKFIHIKSKY